MSFNLKNKRKDDYSKHAPDLESKLILWDFQME